MSHLDLRVYVVTDSALAGPRGVVRTVEGALAGGASIVQLREKTLRGPALAELAHKLVDLCRTAGVPLIINDLVELAAEVGADGVHVGQDDASAHEARLRLGPDAIVGVSVRTREECRDASLHGASYVAANGVWATPTKTDFGAPLGIDGLKAFVADSELPVVAIGGIHLGNAAELAATGCAGLAVVSSVMSAADPALACRELLEAFERGAAEVRRSRVSPAQSPLA